MSRYAVLGPPGTFSEDAARGYWDDPPGLIYAADISQVFDLVMEGSVDEGLVPIYNSRAGTIGVTMSNLCRHQVYIGGEYALAVKHCLLARAPLDLARVEVVISQPEVFSQCQNFLAQLAPGVRREIVGSTGQAAVYIKQEKRKAAAIGSRRAAEIYDLRVIAESLEDDADNYTVFINLRRTPLERGDKTSILFGLEDRPGSLYQVLGVLAKRGVNLSKLESRPGAAINQDYIFYADIEGGGDDPLIREALDELAEQTAYFRFLGTYRKGRNDRPA